MDTQLQKSRHALSTQLNGKEIEIARLVCQVNQLVAYQISDQQIEDWALSINSISPDLDLIDLYEVIKRMKLGKIDYDTRKGIQNIFLGLEIIDRENKSVKELENNHW